MKVSISIKKLINVEMTERDWKFLAGTIAIVAASAIVCLSKKTDV